MRSIGAEKDEDMFETLEYCFEFTLGIRGGTWLGKVVAQIEQSLAFWMLS